MGIDLTVIAVTLVWLLVAAFLDANVPNKHNLGFSRKVIIYVTWAFAFLYVILKPIFKKD